jgi:putative ABC transport system permease protein
MLPNSVILFFRGFGKNKVISSINLLGLILGMLSTLLILEYVFFERSFDSYQKNSGSIFRIAYNRYNKDGLMYKTANYFSPSGPYLKQTFPEVVNCVTMRRYFDIMVSYTKSPGNELCFNEAKTYYTTTTVFDVFSIQLVMGNTNCLLEPYKVAISERTAKKMFGSDNPMGKIITVNKRDNYTVSGVYKNIPSNSHFKTDYIFSYQTRVVNQTSQAPNWRHDFYYNYIQLKPGTDYIKFSKAALNRMIADNYAQQLKDFGWRDEVFLQPIENIHLYSNLEYETENPGNGTIISLLFWFSLFFLLVAWINYINLVTSQSLDRAKEVGVRKTNGSSQKALMIQFISETFLFNFFAFVITLILFFIINPYFKHWAAIGEVSGGFYVKLTFYGLMLFITGVFLSGFYPSFLLSSYNPVQVLKGKFRNSSNNIMFRKILVTVQFIVSLVFLTGTLVSIKQVNHLISKDTGLNYHSKVALKISRLNATDEEYQDKTIVFRNKLMKMPGIKRLTLTSDIPGQDISMFFNCYRKGFNPSDTKDYFRTDIDSVFLDFFDAKILAGRLFRSSDREEMNYIMLNKTAIKRLGYSNPASAINQVVIDGKARNWTIIGVLGDFNFMTLKTEPVPTFFTSTSRGKRYVCIDFYNPKQSESIMRSIQIEFSSLYPGTPFEYVYLDNKVGAELQSDKTIASEFTLFAILAIIIAVIGMLGLIIITINRNIKEMGVRKVLGATKSNIALLLTMHFIWELGIAIIIAIPFSVVLLKKWFLNNYVYSIELSWWFFAIPVAILCLLLLIVINIMADRVWKLDSVEALRYE